MASFLLMGVTGVEFFQPYLKPLPSPFLVFPFGNQKVIVYIANCFKKLLKKKKKG